MMILVYRSVREKDFLQKHSTYVYMQFLINTDFRDVLKIPEEHTFFLKKIFMRHFRYKRYGSVISLLFNSIKIDS